MIDFSKLNLEKNEKIIEPRDIFMSLPSKSKEYEYPRDVQSEVWKDWFDNKDRKNTIIKMNTGSGKTVVGLMILQSCINQGFGPAVYVVPDNFLIEQVRVEAEKLGLSITLEEDSYSFMTKESILIINIHKLVNGKSIFGLREKNNITIGSIIIDDVHACLDTINNQFSISINKEDVEYSKIMQILEKPLLNYCKDEYLDVTQFNDKRTRILVPYWIWQEYNSEVKNLLKQSKSEVIFHFPLLKDEFELCNCIITSSRIEITPKGISLNKIAKFEEAKRRIFMSATLSDDSVFISTMGLTKEELTNIITPKKANDIGDRLFLFPQLINQEITDDEIRVKIKEISVKYNIAVLVPSNKRAEKWVGYADVLVNKDNIEITVRNLKEKHVGLVVFINKYDGVDLPDEACRVVVIDGIPSVRNEFDAYEQIVFPNSERLLCEQIQKIEQGLGRGVRSNNDYCVALLMGMGLADRLIREDGYRYFSTSTKKQYEISNSIWKQLSESGLKPNIDKIIELFNYSLCIPRSVDWVKLSKDSLASLSYGKDAKVNDIDVVLRRAYEISIKRDYYNAALVIEKYKNSISNDVTKGYLMQYMAEYMNFQNKEESQQILLSAKKLNHNLLTPIAGITFSKLLSTNKGQPKQLYDFIKSENLNQNTFSLRLNSLIEKLEFSFDSADLFEMALKEISFLIGIVSSRPELEKRKGPDNLWCLGDGKYLLIECKNETTTSKINKHDCNQLNGSIEWFENEYTGNGFTCFPLMIHNSNVFEYACSPNSDIRIMTPAKLEEFKQQIRLFSTSLFQNENYSNVDEINKLLVQFNLKSENLFDNFSVKHTISSNK